MHKLANGSGTTVGLVGTDGPPLSPETVGRAPSFLEAPVPLRPVPDRKAFTIVADAEPEQQNDAEADGTEEEPTPPPAAGARRLVVHLLGGDEIEVGAFDDRDAALAAAQELVARISAAEAAGEWPEVEGRFLRPASIGSVDVLVED